MNIRSEFILALTGAIILALASGWMLEGAPEPTPDLRIVLVDASASVTRVSPNYSRRVREVLEREAREAETAGEELAIVIASSNVRRAFGPGEPGEFREQLRGRTSKPFDPIDSNDVGTNSSVASGLQLAERLIDESNAQRVSLLLLGDGTFTGENPGSHLRQLIARGLNWRGMVSLEAELTDVGISGLELPEQIEPGAPLAGALRLDLRVGRAGTRVWDRVEITATDSVGVRTTALQIWDPAVVEESAQASRASASLLSFQIGPARLGRTIIEARLVDSKRANAYDSIPENDWVRGALTVGDPLVVGWLGGNQLRPKLQSYFQAQFPGLVSIPLNSADVAATLPELDALFVFDFSILDLPTQLIDSFVGAGGGLFLAGGWRFLAEWSESLEATKLAGNLPLRPNSSELGTREVLVLVDGSGSMAGAPFASVRIAVRELVRAAPQRDEIELRFFTGGLHKAQLLRERGQRVSSQSERERLATELLDARVPGGTTRIIDSLEQLIVARKASQDEALVFLLTDGREQSDVVKVFERSEQLRAELESTRTRLVVFAVGDDVDLEFLRGLVSDAGDLYAGDELDDLGALFGREVNREFIREEAAIELMQSANDLAREVFPPGVQPAAVQRLIRAQLSPGAFPVLVSDSGEPILAAQRSGSGRLAMMASLPFADWANEWEARLADLTPILRWCARRTSGNESPHVDVEDQLLAVRGLDRGLPLVLHGRILSSSKGQSQGADDRNSNPPLIFCLPTEGAGIADASVRVTQLSEPLSNSAANDLVLELTTTAGEAIHSLPVPQERSPEFREPRKFIDFPAAAEFDPLDSFARKTAVLAPRGAQNTSRAALAALGLGSFMVFAAGWRLSRGATG